MKKLIALTALSLLSYTNMDAAGKTWLDTAYGMYTTEINKGVQFARGMDFTLQQKLGRKDSGLTTKIVTEGDQEFVDCSRKYAKKTTEVDGFVVVNKPKPESLSSFSKKIFDQKNESIIAKGFVIFGAAQLIYQQSQNITQVQNVLSWFSSKK